MFPSMATGEGGGTDHKEEEPERRGRKRSREAGEPPVTSPFARSSVHGEKEEGHRRGSKKK